MFTKEILENCGAFILQDARGDLAAVIERWHLKEIDDAASRAGARIGTAKDDAADASVNDGPGAHRTRLLRHVKIAIDQTPIASRLFGLSQREHLGVGRRVMEKLDLIVSASDNFSGADDDTADWNLVSLARLFRKPQRFVHVLGVTLFFGHDVQL